MQLWCFIIPQWFRVFDPELIRFTESSKQHGKEIYISVDITCGSGDSVVRSRRCRSGVWMS